MGIRTVTNAKLIALRSYSMWANYLGIAALIMPEGIYLIWGVDTNPRIWWISGLVLILFGIGGRLVDQGITRSPAIVVLASVFLAMSDLTGATHSASSAVSASPASESAFLAVAEPLVSGWEGKENVAYLDRIASPPVWTVCHGETRGVQRGDSYTDAECRAMLERGLLEYRDELHRYFTDQTKATRLPAARDAAYVSLAWNVGIAGAGKSTATRRLNAGNIAGGCKAITWWNRAGDRVVRGLVNRRADEYRLCMIGVA